MTKDMEGGSASTLMQYLKGMQFPAQKTDLEKIAKRNGADDAVLKEIRNLPGDSFNTMADVEEACGEKSSR
ncbi:MAG TPA: hypothetical protein DCY07_00750 [Rhodospirillaceae bacterium]|nr:hypothetical protein [Rhodospirillaceae bacterium]